jgi:hypothetical protein
MSSEIGEHGGEAWIVGLHHLFGDSQRSLETRYASVQETIFLASNQRVWGLSPSGTTNKSAE